jgi:hypothetical protein
MPSWGSSTYRGTETPTPSSWIQPSQTALDEEWGTQLVAVAKRHAKAAGCRWLHVDFDQPVSRFYLDACGFVPTAAGLIDLVWASNVTSD